MLARHARGHATALAMVAIAAALAQPLAAGAHHDRATRICERGDPGNVYGKLDSNPIETVEHRRRGRLVLAYRALGWPRFKVCAVAIRRSHRGEAHMRVRLGFVSAPHRWRRDAGRFGRYAGPVYLSARYDRRRHDQIDVKGVIGRGWNQGFANYSAFPPG